LRLEPADQAGRNGVPRGFWPGFVCPRGSSLLQAGRMRSGETVRRMWYCRINPAAPIHGVFPKSK
jgi:hypothetical protein